MTDQKPEALPFKCADCGAPSLDWQKPCDCVTRVGFRRVSNTNEYVIWPEPPDDDACGHRALIQTLTEALRKYGHHHQDCQINWQPNPSCTCGYDAALAHAEAHEKETAHDR